MGRLSNILGGLAIITFGLGGVFCEGLLAKEYSQMPKPIQPTPQQYERTVDYLKANEEYLKLKDERNSVRNNIILMSVFSVGTVGVGFGITHIKEEPKKKKEIV